MNNVDKIQQFINRNGLLLNEDILNVKETTASLTYNHHRASSNLIGRNLLKMTPTSSTTTTKTTTTNMNTTNKISNVNNICASVSQSVCSMSNLIENYQNTTNSFNETNMNHEHKQQQLNKKSSYLFTCKICLNKFDESDDTIKSNNCLYQIQLCKCKFCKNVNKKIIF